MPGFSLTRVVELLAADPYARSLGVDLVSVTEDGDRGRDDRPSPSPQLPRRGPWGLVFSLADCAFLPGSNSAGDRAVAIDTHLVLTAPVDVGDVLQGVGRRDCQGSDPRAPIGSM